MIKKKDLLKTLMDARQLTLINYNDANWNIEGVITLWKSKDGKNEIVLNVDELEWAFK